MSESRSDVAELGRALDDILGDPDPSSSARFRVRDQISRRLERSTRWRRTAGLLAVAAAFGVCAIAIALSSRSVSHAPIPAEVVHAGASLGPGILELPSRARVEIHAGADLRLLGDDADGTRFELARGVVLVHVDPRPTGPRFVIEVPNASVEVVGTTFAVGVSDAGETRVQGRDGTVAVVTKTGRTFVRSGDRWPADAPLLVTNDDAWRTVSGTASTEPVDAKPPTPAAAVEHPPARAVTRGKRVLSQFEQAKRLEEDGDIAAALVAYKQIATADSTEAEDALYAVGRIELHRQREPATALATFFAYRRRFPSGRYARAVDVHVLDIAIANNDRELIEQEAARFLADHSDDPRAARFRLARASLRAERGDCAAARADLAHVPKPSIPAAVLQRCP